jgi:hypothetical protein
MADNVKLLPFMPCPGTGVRMYVMNTSRALCPACEKPVNLTVKGLVPRHRTKEPVG